jgi:hypothetical protein
MVWFHHDEIVPCGYIGTDEQAGLPLGRSCRVGTPNVKEHFRL